MFGKKNLFGDHFGRHLGFLSSPSVIPIYAGSFRNYRPCQTFWCMTLLGGVGGVLPLEIVAFLAHSHPAIYQSDRYFTRSN